MDVKEKSAFLPKSLVNRIPAYYRIICDMEAEGIRKTTSGEISERLGNTSSQVRQDFYVCGGTDGYEISKLKEWLERIIGVKNEHRMIVVGAGNIGRAIMSFGEFREEGFIIEAAFDSNLLLDGMQVNGIPIMSTAFLEGYLDEHAVDIIIIAAPAAAAKSVLCLAEAHGTDGIWNFAPVDLKSETVKIRNVHLGDALLSLSFEIEKDK